MEKEVRFEFGENWTAFLETLTEEKITDAVKSLEEWLPNVEFEGKTFLDIGSGSGLFSLAARKLGAIVYSFDYDKDSVACTNELKERYFRDDEFWIIEQGDVLDEEYMTKYYGQFDIVYSWGVLHHTGNMYKGLNNAWKCLKDQALLYIAIYNDQGQLSNRWRKIKKTYCSFGKVGKRIMIFFVLVWEYVIQEGWRFVKHPIRFCKSKIQNRKVGRGMNRYHDIIDWYGGYPFETAKPEEIFEFYHKRKMILEKLFTSYGSGCNQYVFSQDNRVQ